MDISTRGLQGELIDTLWNVNPAGMAILAPKLTELIDTLWNVNTNAIALLPIAS